MSTEKTTEPQISALVGLWRNSNNAVTRPDRVLAVTEYWWRKWLPLLGWERWFLVTNLRWLYSQQVGLNGQPQQTETEAIRVRQSSEGDIQVEFKVADLAIALGISQKTLYRLLDSEPIEDEKPWRRLVIRDRARDPGEAQQVEMLRLFIPRLRYIAERRNGVTQRTGMLIELVIDDFLTPTDAQSANSLLGICTRSANAQKGISTGANAKKGICTPGANAEKGISTSANAKKGTLIYNNTTTTNTPPYPPQIEIESPFEEAIAATWRAATAQDLDRHGLERLCDLLANTTLDSLLVTIVELGRRKEYPTPEDVEAIITGRLAMPPLLDRCTPPQRPASAPVIAPARPDDDPVLAEVTRLYEQEIGTRITQLVADDLRDLTAEQRDLDVWGYAFQTSAHIHNTKGRWNYITAIVRAPDLDTVRAWIAAGRKRPQPERKPHSASRSGGDGRGRSVQSNARARGTRAPVVSYEDMPDPPPELLAEPPLPPPD